MREHRKKGGGERGQGNSVKQHPEWQRWAEWSNQAEHSSGNHVAKLDGLNEDSLKHGASKTGTLKISGRVMSGDKRAQVRSLTALDNGGKLPRPNFLRRAHNGTH